MRYIEPHGHMVSRTTDDYQAMAMAGCQAVSEPAFWAGFDRSSVQGFYDYFCQLTQHEPRRAAMFGLPHYTWLCINPKESEDLKLADEVLGIIPEFMGSPNVLGIGVNPRPHATPRGQAQGHAADSRRAQERQPHQAGALHH